MCIFLAQELTKLGFTVAIVSRGYGRLKAPGKKDPILVSLGQGPLVSVWESGDEPALMALKTPALVVCAKKRAKAAEAAIQYGAQILILDDGFQHLGLHRDLDILMLKSEQPFGNNLVLPAGPLREDVSAHQKAHVFVTLGQPDAQVLSLTQGRPLFRANLKPLGFQPLVGGPLLPLDFPLGAKVLAFCGLANPSSFFNSLSNLGLEPTACLTFADHASYEPHALYQLTKFFTDNKADYLLTTPKDAVKLPPALNLPVLSLQTELTIEDSEKFINFTLEHLGLAKRR
jgi:tetraacyldisaccharide 4'-kinase